MGFVRHIYKKNKQRGFTLIELLVVISIIGLLASVTLVALNIARSNGRKTTTHAIQKQLITAADTYMNDMGFYPPDVIRGVDPGFATAYPVNYQTTEDCNIDLTKCDCPSTVLSCGNGQLHLPSDWKAQVAAKWRGPYISKWPRSNPFGGYYDYNYFPSPISLGSPACNVPAGVYIGTNYGPGGAGYPLPNEEQWFLDNKYDADGCLNQLLEAIIINL